MVSAISVVMLRIGEVCELVSGPSLQVGGGGSDQREGAAGDPLPLPIAGSEIKDGQGILVRVSGRGFWVKLASLVDPKPPQGPALRTRKSTEKRM